MAVVPFLFANQTGPIPLSELDTNFANVKAFAETAGNVTGNIQANITAVGTLVSLTVSGNVTAPVFQGNLIGNVTGNISGNVTSPGSNTQVLFNDNGLANATAGLTFNKSTNVLSAAGNINSAQTISAFRFVSTNGLSTTGTVIANNLSTGNVVITSLGNVNCSDHATGNVLHAVSGIIGVPPGTPILYLGNNNPSTVYLGGNSGNVYIANVNSVTRIAGNLTAGGSVSAVGNILTNSSVSATGNIALEGIVSAVGNILTGASMSAAGNITAGANITTTLSMSAIGNITGGNILTNGNISLSGNLTASGNTALSGNATAPTAANGTNTTQIATTAFVTNAVNNGVPAGVILLWSGNIASIPAGWALCNGANGTPDLRDRFVVGAGSTYAVAATGGSANAVVVSHTHTATSNVSDPGHSHNYVTYASLQPQQGLTTNCWVGTSTATTTSNTTGISVSTTISSSGSSGTNANLPPYYALAYIMKL